MTPGKCSARRFRLCLCGSFPLALSIGGAALPPPDPAGAEAAPQASCGDCPNPLVMFRDTRYAGDLPSFEEYDQWEDIKKGNYGSVLSQRSRAFAVLFAFTKANPCADTQYALTESIAAPGAIVGKKGRAKYAVDTRILFKSGAPGEKALVRRSVGGQSRLALVPKLGTIEVTHTLVALKNNETYDTGRFFIDWVEDPPQGEEYFHAQKDQKLEAEGRVWAGGNGLISGSFPPDRLETDIEFSKGDVGVTIRKKETPAACSLYIDDTVQRGTNRLYRLRIEDIENQFRETLPANVRIALRVKSGKLLGGESIGEWHVYQTAGGRIPGEILYDLPQCDRAYDDTLEIAGVCDFHDGPASVGETRIRKRIPNSRCVSFAILRGAVRETRTSDCTETSAGYSKKWKSKEESSIEASVLMSFEDVYSVNYLERADEYRWVLRVKEIVLSDFDYRRTFERSSQDYDSMNPPLRKDTREFSRGWAADPTVIAKNDRVIQIYFDGKTRRAKRAFMSADIGFLQHHETRMTGRERQAGPGIGDPYYYVDMKPLETVQEARHRFAITAVQSNAGKPASGGGSYRDHEVSFGDGIDFFGGQGEVVRSEALRAGCTRSTEQRTFRWEIHLKPVK